jgi:hypothetical protein
LEKPLPGAASNFSGLPIISVAILLEVGGGVAVEVLTGVVGDKVVDAYGVVVSAGVVVEDVVVLIFDVEVVTGVVDVPPQPVMTTKISNEIIRENILDWGLIIFPPCILKK